MSGDEMKRLGEFLEAYQLLTEKHGVRFYDYSLGPHLEFYRPDKDDHVWVTERALQVSLPSLKVEASVN